MDSWDRPDDSCVPGMGSQARNPNQIALAVDPKDSRVVYYVYGDVGGAEGDLLTLHLGRWSDINGVRTVIELLTVPNSLNPALAVAKSGRIGFAYQRYDAGNWQTHIQLSSSDHLSWRDVRLTGSSPDAEPIPHCGWTSPYLGDYMDIATVGETFYGTFSFNNNPVRNPNAVYLRDKTLLGTAVPYTVDPFFYKVTVDRPIYWIVGSYLKRITARLLELLNTVQRHLPWPPRPDPPPPPTSGARQISLVKPRDYRTRAR